MNLGAITVIGSDRQINQSRLLLMSSMRRRRTGRCTSAGTKRQMCSLGNATRRNQGNRGYRNSVSNLHLRTLSPTELRGYVRKHVCGMAMTSSKLSRVNGTTAVRTLQVSVRRNIHPMANGHRRSRRDHERHCGRRPVTQNRGTEALRHLKVSGPGRAHSDGRQGQGHIKGPINDGTRHTIRAIQGHPSRVRWCMHNENMTGRTGR